MKKFIGNKDFYKLVAALALPLLIVCHPVLAFLHRKFTL